MAVDYCRFPSDFVWGVSTAAYQVEGAVAEDGRGPSVWDVFCRRPGAIVNGQNGDHACDHYHLYKQDVALMKAMGVKAYRFSAAWPRIFPDGTGQINMKGLDFYQRLVDELLAAGIQPWMTLMHWDLPQALEDRYRGWESRQCALDFAQYAGCMASHFGDRVAGIFTMNEFICFLDKGYGFSDEPFAPGKQTSRQVLNQARHHAILAHGLAVQAIRAVGKCRVGLAENIPNCAPILETPEHITATRNALRELTGMFLTPILEGAYHPAYLEKQAADAPVFTDEDMKIISSPVDFVGLNLYAPTYIRHDSASPDGWSIVKCDEHYPRMHMPWLTLGPSITYWGPRLVAELWKVKSIFITENGCAYPDVPDADNKIWDTARVMYLQQHLIGAHRAVSEGYGLKGYFLWSLMDNFEWACGYTKRFGLHYVNYDTMERLPKLSAEFYSHIIRRNALG